MNKRASSNGELARWNSLLLPAALVLALVLILPMGGIALISLHPSTGKGQVGSAFTLRNYADFLSDPFYLHILATSFLLALISAVVTLVVAYPVAYFLARTPSRFRGLFHFLVFAPLLVSVLIRNLGWLPLLAQDGTINTVLMDLGVTSRPLPLANNFAGVTIGMVHALLPYMILILAGVIRSVGRELEEASINLGAGPIETFFRVILPLTRAGATSGCLLVFTIAIGAFTTPAIMGGNRVLVVTTYISQQMRTLLNYPRGATAAVILLLFVGALTLLALLIGEPRSRSA
jgi:putative spermidine/putrescine transport system permease protein